MLNTKNGDNQGEDLVVETEKTKLDAKFPEKSEKDETQEGANLETNLIENTEQNENHENVLLDEGGEIIDVPSINISRYQAALDIGKLSLPLALSRSVTIAQGFISTMIISQISTEIFAASNLFNTLGAVLTSTAMSATYSVSILVGEACGQRNLPLAGRILNQGWIYAIIVSIPTVGIALASRPILLLLGQAENYAQISQDYFFAAALSIPGNILLVCSQQFADATKRPIIDFVTTFLNTGMTLGLSYVLALGKLGVTPRGVVGLGIANSASAWLTFSGLLIYYKCSPSFREYDIFHNQFRETLHLLKRLFKVGVPIGFRSFLEMAAFFMANIMVGWLKNQDDLIAQQSANQYLLLFGAPYMSIAISTSILVSRAVGENNFLNARRLGYTGLNLSLGITTILAFTCVFGSEFLLSAFIDVKDVKNAHIVSLSSDLLKVHAADLILDTVRNLSSGSLMGIFDTESPLFASIIALLAVATPAGYVLGFPVGWGLLGVYIARDIGVMLSAGYLLNKWRYQSNNAVEAGRLSNGTGVFTKCYGLVSTLFNRNERNNVPTPYLPVAQEATASTQPTEVTPIQQLLTDAPQNLPSVTPSSEESNDYASSSRCVLF